ncbi:MAG: SIMPL domain-containing protein [Deltaproteobacteria bacterium]|nr:MAG: SIMPL domain-containing protein [Deltaproteobacteria bacterium]
MKRKISFLSLAICIFLSLAQLSYAEEKPQPSTIEVVGKARVMTMPNVATVTFAVETNSTKAQLAVRENAKQTDKLLNTLKDIGKQKIKIRTSGFTLTPVYDKDNRFQPRGYRVTNTVIVETKEIDQVGTFIDEASKAGVSRIGSLTFSTDGEEKLRKEAAVQALNQAKDIAADLAKAAGLTIKKIVKVSYTPRGPAPLYRMEAMAATARTPIEVGEITMEETVHVIFETN